MRVGVVGGGPAGSRGAELLAVSGARVLIYEARTGWEKPCGGGVPERGVDARPSLRDASLPHARAARARLVSPSGREAIVPLAEPLRVYSRRDLNLHLLDRARRAGAGVRETRATGLERIGREWEVRDASGRRERFDFLIGADGAAGIVRDRLGMGLPGLRPALGVGYFLEGSTGNEIVLKFFSDLDGYLWIFPRVDHLAAGICGPPGGGSGEALRKQLDRFLIDLLGAAVLNRARRYGALIPEHPAAASGRIPCQGPGWALAGDAAGFVDPLTREGIAFALTSAEILAGALAEGVPERYAPRFEASCGQDLGWAAEHKGRFFSSRFLEALTLFSSASPALQEILADLIAGRQPYASLRGRLVRTAPSVAGSLCLAMLSRILLGSAESPPPSPGRIA